MLDTKLRKGASKINQDEVNQHYIAKGAGPLPSSVAESDLGLVDIYEHNILVTTWLDDLGYTQKEHEEKILFFNSEKILNKGKGGDRKILHHFSKDNKSIFADRNVEFSCKKGQLNH